MPLVSKNKNIDDEDETTNSDNNSSSNRKNFVPVKKLNKDKDNNNKKPKWEYNNKTSLSYLKNGLSVPDHVDLHERVFLSKVSVDPKLDHSIRKEITKIVRIKAIDYTSKKFERKEFLYWFENWHGVNWRGLKIAPVTDHIEGFYFEQEMEPVTVEQNEIVGHKRTGQHPIYYIPFSKEKVDKIIESSMGTGKDTIKFLFIDGQLSYEFPYEDFVNRSYEELAAMLIIPGGPKTILQKQQLEKFKQDQQQISELLTTSTITTTTSTTNKQNNK